MEIVRNLLWVKYKYFSIEADGAYSTRVEC
jgi:hypothetical protein